jgi:hypothetical protein
MDGGPLKISAKATFHAVDAGGYALALIPTRVSPVDLRTLENAFEISDDIDRGSRLHWEEFRNHLPKRFGGESVVTLGLDEEATAETESERTSDLSQAEDEIW